LAQPHNFHADHGNIFPLLDLEGAIEMLAATYDTQRRQIRNIRLNLFPHVAEKRDWKAQIKMFALPVWVYLAYHFEFLLNTQSNSATSHLCTVTLD
jgi:hypothetical protein